MARFGQSAGAGAREWLTTLRGAAVAARVLTAVMWCLVACGPLAMVTAAVHHGKPGTSAPVTSSQGTSGALGAAGFAELYVVTYLRSGGTGSALQAFYPGLTDLTGQSGMRQVTTATVLGVTQVSSSYWSVLVAAGEATASGRSLGVHYFQVAVASSGSASSPAYVATALPAEVAAPAQAAEPQLSYDTTVPVPSGPLTAAVSQFLAAYLTGSGNLSRYLAPGAALSPVAPAPYLATGSVTVYSPDGTAHPGAATIRVLAQVQATDSAGDQWPLTYALIMTTVAGQWDIAALDPAPALAAGPPVKGR